MFGWLVAIGIISKRKYTAWGYGDYLACLRRLVVVFAYDLAPGNLLVVVTLSSK